MITAIPQRVAQASRQVTLKHPNALHCFVFRKKVVRQGNAGPGGLPTLGGMGVLSSEDEPEFEYVKLGEARILITSHFEPSSLSDSENFPLPVSVAEAQIEPLDVTAFDVQKNDLVAATPGGGVLIAFEVVDMPSTVNIYPYTRKFVVSPRDDLHDLAPWNEGGSPSP